MRFQKGPIFFLLVAQLICCVVLADEQNHFKEWNFSFMTGRMANYIFPGSDASKVSNIGLLAGKSYGAAGQSTAFYPYGFEVEKYGLIENSRSYYKTSFRVLPTQFQLSTQALEQKGFDGFLAVTYGWFSVSHLEQWFSLEGGLRFRKWRLGTGALPSLNHFGLIILGKYFVGNWNILFEAGLMAASFGVSQTLGLQRDSSTLRIQLARHWFLGQQTITPWVEFFHTHRSFYSSSLLLSETALFIDEPNLIIGLSYGFNK